MLTEHCVVGGVAGPEGVAESRLVVVNVYCPMYDPLRDKEGEGLGRLQFKLNFYRLLEGRCSALESAGKSVAVQTLTLLLLTCHAQKYRKSYHKN